MEDFFAKICYIKQLFNTIKLAKDYIVNNNKSLYLKYSYSTSFIKLALENKI